MGEVVTAMTTSWGREQRTRTPPTLSSTPFTTEMRRWGRRRCRGVPTTAIRTTTTTTTTIRVVIFGFLACMGEEG